MNRVFEARRLGFGNGRDRERQPGGPDPAPAEPVALRDERGLDGPCDFATIRLATPATYLWHLVDVVRIGTERLWTLHLDPAEGIPCWDESDLADARRYDRLSTAVGLHAFAHAAVEWRAAAGRPTSAVVRHAGFGELTATDIIRRNAHEVVHHHLDIERGLKATRGQ